MKYETSNKSIKEEKNEEWNNLIHPLHYEKNNKSLRYNYLANPYS